MLQLALLVIATLNAAGTSSAWRWQELDDCELPLPEFPEDLHCRNGHPEHIALPSHYDADMRWKCQLCATGGRRDWGADRCYDHICEHIPPHDELCDYVNIDDENSVNTYVEWCGELDRYVCADLELQQDQELEKEFQLEKERQEEWIRKYWAERNSWWYFIKQWAGPCLILFVLILVGIVGCLVESVPCTCNCKCRRCAHSTSNDDGFLSGVIFGWIFTH